MVFPFPRTESLNDLSDELQLESEDILDRALTLYEHLVLNYFPLEHIIIHVDSREEIEDVSDLLGESARYASHYVDTDHNGRDYIIISENGVFCLDRISKKTGLSPEEIISKAFVLYRHLDRYYPLDYFLIDIGDERVTVDVSLLLGDNPKPLTDNPLYIKRFVENNITDN